MGALIDWTGRRQGRLKIVKRLPNQGVHVMWLAQCDCGATVKLRAHSLNAEGTRSCGCYQRDVMAELLKTHGRSKRSAIYRTWKQMHGRCKNPSIPNYKNYGGRGIYVDPRWDDFAVFEKDMGPKPSSAYSLDRIDNDGPYSPENCRWATRIQQARNSRQVRYLEAFGERKPVYAWVRDPRCKAKNLSTMYSRLYRGWSDEETIKIPHGGSR